MRERRILANAPYELDLGKLAITLRKNLLGTFRETRPINEASRDSLLWLLRQSRALSARAWWLHNTAG
jgi:hypothetical protein